MSRDARTHTFRYVRTAKMQISLRIRAMWSESSLNAFYIARAAQYLHVDSEYSIQTARMRRLILVFVGRTYQKVCFPHNGSSIVGVVDYKSHIYLFEISYLLFALLNYYTKYLWKVNVVYIVIIKV